jgi:lysophospholipase L1-like esterase
LIQQYLALGDSYTIGEGVALFHSFPYQLTRALRAKGIQLSAPEIIAKTGFTADELLSRVISTRLLNKYNLVTLLIGVNNQYRGLVVEDFKVDFEKILDIAIRLAGFEPQRVYVLSIPDYGKSPFCSKHDKNKISAEIAAFNKVKADICKSHQVSFTDITTTFEDDLSKSFYVEDGLHPSPFEYSRWVNLLLKEIHVKLY